MWRKVKKILAWTIGVILSLIFITTVLVYIFEDDIKKYAVERLNENLNTRVDVEEIELSIWKRFPYASLTFKNVLIKDAFQYNKGIDTLLYAENIYFDFSLYDLWNEDYNIKKIEAENGVFNMRINENGDVNYNILKEKKEQTESNFEFELEDVVLQNFRYTFQNEETGQDYAIKLNKGHLAGDFLAEKYTLSTQIDADIKHIKSGQIPILFEQSFSGDVDIDINNIDTTYTIHAGEIELSEIPLYFDGYFDKGQFEIKLKGENLNLAEVTNKMQGQYNTDYTMYDGSGKVDFNLDVIKNDSTDNTVAIAAEFGVQKGQLHDPSTGLSLKNIALKGTYHSHKSVAQKLTLENLHFETLKGGFDGMLIIEDFKLPTITTKMKGSLDLATIHKFFNIQTIQSVDGTVAANINAKLKFKNIKNRPDQFSMVYANGAFELIKTNIQLANDSRVWKNLNGKFVLSGNDAAMKDVAVQLGQSDLELNGALKNFVPFLQNAGPLHITSALVSDKIKIEDFYNKKATGSSQKQTQKLLPNNVTLDFTGKINLLTFEHHPYQNVYGHAVLNNHKLVLDDMRFKNSEGSYSGKVVINDQPVENATISVFLNVRNVNIKKLFSEWNNFDQEVVLAKNIEGVMGTNIQLTVPIQRSGKVMYENLNGTVGISIEKGELNNLPMMKSTADYLAENKIIRMALGSNLSHIQQKLEKLSFEKLSNTIQIKNQKLIMPEMTIHSNVMDVNLSAEHWFNNDIDYHFDFRFRDLKVQKQSSEFGTIEDDGTGIRLFFRMYGNTSNPQFAFDKDKRKEARKEKFDQEKQTIKSMLKEEFNLYQNDTTVSDMDQTPHEKQVDFEFSGEGFDEEKDAKKEEKPEKDNKSKTNKFFNRLKNEQKEKEKEEQTIEIGI